MVKKNIKTIGNFYWTILNIKGQMKSGAPIATQEKSKGNLGLFLVKFGALNLVGSNVVNSQGDKGHFQTPIPVSGVVVLLGGMNFHFV